MGLAQKQGEERIRPQVLPGFDGIKSYWDSTHHYHSARIRPGEYYVTCGEEIITTVLGSCVAACIRDTRAGIGGMNHFMLPKGAGADLFSSESSRYGSYAMEKMINSLLSNGGRRETLEIKLFGGSKILQSQTDIGQQNIDFVRKYLMEEDLPVLTEDMGGFNPRKIIYFPFNGTALVKKLPRDEENTVSSEEKNYLERMKKQPASGEIDLF